MNFQIFILDFIKGAMQLYERVALGIDAEANNDDDDDDDDGLNPRAVIAADASYIAVLHSRGVHVVTLSWFVVDEKIFLN